MVLLLHLPRNDVKVSISLIQDPNIDKISHSRPYWHVDAKWVCGLLAVIVTTILLLLVGLYRLTDRSSAPAFTTAVAESALSKAEVGIDTLQLEQKLEPLYEQGPDGVADAFTDDPLLRQQIAKQLQVFSLFTDDSHRQLGWGLVVAIAATLAVFGGLVFFSHRFGRLVSIGVVLLAAALPGFLLFLTMSTGNGTDGMRIGDLGSSVLNLVSAAFLPGYMISVILAVVLLVAAAILGLTSAVPKK